MFPKCTADEMRRYLLDSSPLNNVQLFSRQDITDAENRIEVTKKRGSTTAAQFFEPRNIFRRNLFWTSPFPLGRLGIPRAELMDLDECGLFLQTANRNYGLLSERYA